MNVIGIQIRPDRTEIIEAKLVKGDIVRILRQESLYPCYSMIEQLRTVELSEFFQDIRSRVKHKNAPVYFGISDNLIKKIDCQEHEAILPEKQNTLIPWMEQVLQLSQEEYYISTPILFQEKSNTHVTGMAVRRTYIDIILKAADEAALNLQTIEPAAFALLRFLNQWDSEHCVMEVWEKSTTITSFNPINGMMTITLAFGWSYFLEQASGHAEFIDSILKHDYTAYSTYGLANNNIPIYIVSDRAKQLSELLTADALYARLRDPLHFMEEHPFLIASSQPISAAAAGLVLTPLHERMVSLYDTNTAG